MKKVGMILGSTRPTRISLEIGEWAQKILNCVKIYYDLIDLKKVNLPFLNEPEMPISGNYHHSYTKHWSKLVQSYDGIIFLLPQYNAGIPAVLKNAIDYLAKEWVDKPVSYVSYGFHGGNQSALAMALVMDRLRMRRMAVNPMLTIKMPMFNSAGHFKDIRKSFAPYTDDVRLLKQNFQNVLLKRN